jgi:glycosyltransferase involved in cell wall biosynthesis
MTAASQRTRDLAIVANVRTPYRLHLHRRIARELPGVRLWSLFTHDQPDQPWVLEAAAEIRPVNFGAGEPVVGSANLRRTIREWRKAGRIIRWLAEHRVGAVMICGYNDAGRIRLIRWCRRARVPCFLVADSNARSDRASGLKLVAKRLVVGAVTRWCTGFMPCGSLGVEFLVRYGADRNRMFLVPYEPDYDLIRSVGLDRIGEARHRLGLAEGRRGIVFCGRLVPVKRADLAIAAFAAIARERPEWDLVIIGDGPLRAPLQASVSREIRDRVKWAGFVGDQGELSALYAACDLLLHPAEFEPWAVVINEAAAAGLAIVASDAVGAAAELVRDGVNGRAFRAGDLSQLIACLRETTDPARIDALKAASPLVLDDWRRVADPVAGIRRALQAAGVLPAASHPRIAPSTRSTPAVR